MIMIIITIFIVYTARSKRFGAKIEAFLQTFRARFFSQRESGRKKHFAPYATARTL